MSEAPCLLICAYVRIHTIGENGVCAREACARESTSQTRFRRDFFFHFRRFLCSSLGRVRFFDLLFEQ